MELLRIPTSYSIQIRCLSDEDCRYVFQTLFELTEGNKVEIEFSPRGGIVQSIWRECIQLENKARSKKGGESLCYDLAPMVQPKSNLSATKPSQTKSNQVKPSQIKPQDNNSVELFKEVSEIDTLLSEFKKSRARLRKPMTDKAMQLLLKKLSEYSLPEQIKMLEEAIEKGWQSVYPPKSGNKYGKNPDRMEAMAKFNIT